MPAMPRRDLSLLGASSSIRRSGAGRARGPKREPTMRHRPMPRLTLDLLLDLILAIVALASIGAAVWRLEAARDGVGGETLALAFARNGYVAVTFDFPGHGRNPRPMAGVS